MITDMFNVIMIMLLSPLSIFLLSVVGIVAVVVFIHDLRHRNDGAVSHTSTKVWGPLANDCSPGCRNSCCR